jgi:uncharacterized protein YgiM (DUF1202 family)
MYKNYHLNKILFISLIVISIFFITNIAHSHKIDGKEHDPITCKLESERMWWEKLICKDAQKRHRLCKLDEQCAIIELDEQQKKIDELENNISKNTPVDCKNLTFSHVALKNTSLFQKTSSKSTVIEKIKKGQKISFVGSTDKKGWIIVVPKGNVCKIGYINESYIGLSTQTATKKKEAPKLKSNIKITYPKWEKVNELIVLENSGFFEIDGFVNKDQGINKVIINYDGNDEEMILGSDGSFNGSLQIENSLDVRITTFKNEKQIGKALVFKVEVE